MKTMRRVFFTILMITATMGLGIGAQSKKATKYPLKMTTYGFDQKERTISVKAAPKKVYVDGKNNLDIIYALGAEDAIAGVLNPGDDYLAKIKKTNPNVTVTEWEGAKEFVIALNPDFIIGWYGLFYKSSLDEVDYWHNKGIGTYVSLNSGARKLNGKTVANVDGELQDILNLGQIFNKNQKAIEIVTTMKDEIAKIQKYVKGKKKIGVAILEAGDKGYRIYGVDSLAGDMAIKVGGTLQMGQDGNGSASAENIIQVNPEVIVMVTYESLGTPESQVEKVLKNPYFASLRAVKNKRVFGVDLSLVYASGIKTGEGLKVFAQAFYPELYK